MFRGKRPTKQRSLKKRWVCKYDAVKIYAGKFLMIERRYFAEKNIAVNEEVHLLVYKNIFMLGKSNKETIDW